MAFADWKKRSAAFANAMTHSVTTRSNILRAMQAAYKAGERQGRNDATDISQLAVRLAVAVERETCAAVAENFDFNDRQEINKPRNLPRYVAAAIRARALTQS
jgi:hypothetical protein